MLRQTPQPNVLAGGGPGLSPMFWGLIVLTGIATGLGSGLLMLLLRAVEQVAWTSTAGTSAAGSFLDRVQHASAWRRVLVMLEAALLVAAVRWLLSRRTGGHGSELTAAIWFHRGRMSAIGSLTNAVVSIVIVAMGASVGREAAPKQIGALTASLLGEWRKLPAPQRRLLAACGAGAGMGAVYDVPFGGAMFALEVLLGTLSLELVAPALATSMIATWVSWLLLPDRATYRMPPSGVSAPEIVWAALAGPIIGVAAVGYVRLICWADGGKPTGKRFGGACLLLTPLLAFLAVGVLAIRFPQLLGNGKDVVQQTLLGQIDLPVLVALLLLRPLATAACLGSGAPGGLFTPTMTCGALLGAVLSQPLSMLWPAIPSGACALIGATALLAAATQGPVSAIVLVIELTRSLDSWIVPMLVTVAGAVLVARRLESRSIYSGRIHTGRMATDNQRPNTGFRLISAAAPYGEMLHSLLASADPKLPLYVVDEKGALVGEIDRRDAVSPDPTLVPLAVSTAADFAHAVPALDADDAAQHRPIGIARG